MKKTKWIFWLLIFIGYSSALLAADTGAKVCATVENSGIWDNCVVSALNTSDDNHASVASATAEYFEISDFTFGLVSGYTINGIVVNVEFSSTSWEYTAYVKCALSWNDGTNYTSDSAEQSVANATDETKTFGGSTNTWGRTWAVSEFANGTFRLKVYGRATVSLVKIDYITVTVYYTTSAGSRKLIMIN